MILHWQKSQQFSIRLPNKIPVIPPFLRIKLWTELMSGEIRPGNLLPERPAQGDASSTMRPPQLGTLIKTCDLTNLTTKRMDLLRKKSGFNMT